jgi:uncharacterized protein (DUF111 family)
MNTDREQRELSVLECNVNDTNPERCDCVSECLFAAGADDVWLTAGADAKESAGDIVECAEYAATNDDLDRSDIDRNHGALSVRRYPVVRTALARETVRMATRYGEIAIKTRIIGGGGCAVN